MAGLPIILDTDVGTDVDDAIAISLLLASPELDLRVVTTVSGDAVLRARIVKKLLTLGGRPDVPVAAGVREPVLRQRNFLWLGHEGKAIVSDQDRLPLVSAHAVDVLIDTLLRERPQLVMIGPLSNLAVAIMKEPSVIPAIRHLTIMGGSLGINRDPTVPLLEYNLSSDAEASLVVLNAGIPITLVPLDVTWRTFFTTAELARLRQSGSTLVQVLCDAIEIWWRVQQAYFEGDRTYSPDVVAFLHDPLTLAVLLEPSLVVLQRRRLRPEIRDGIFHLCDDPGGTEVEVAVDVDAPRFVQFLIERLLRLP